MVSTWCYFILPVVVFIGLLRKCRERTWGRCRSTGSLQGRVFLVTGANSGIGKETVRELAKRKATVIMACRDVQSAKNVVAEIRSKIPTGELVIMRDWEMTDEKQYESYWWWNNCLILFLIPCRSQWNWILHASRQSKSLPKRYWKISLKSMSWLITQGYMRHSRITHWQKMALRFILGWITWATSCWLIYCWIAWSRALLAGKYKIIYCMEGIMKDIKHRNDV